MADRPTDAENGSRHLIIVSLLVSTIFTLLLAIGLGVVGSKAITAGRESKKVSAANSVLLAQMSDLIAQNAIRDQATCVATNKTRAEVVDVWEFIFTLNPNPDQTAQDRIDRARAKIADTYRQRPCPP